MSDFTGWDTNVLKQLGYPVTAQNLAFLRRWHLAEGGTASYNPLNTTQPWQGASSYNSVGVKNFPNAQAGIAATVKTLKNGNYPAILQALKSGNPSWSAQLAQNLSTWGTGSSWMKGYKNGPLPPAPQGSPQASAPIGQSQTAMPSPGTDQFKSLLASQLLQAGQHGGISPQGLLSLVYARQQLGAAQDTFGPQQGGTGAPVASQGGAIGQTAAGKAGSVIRAAESQLGQPYVWGGESRKEGGFDCSGLIDYAMRQAGIPLPYRLTTQSAAKLGSSVKGSSYKPGDLILADNNDHMVMYVGNGMVIAAPHTGAKVQYQPLSDFSGRITDVRRVF